MDISSAEAALGPFLFTFTAGMVATVNPCGFAMVPAYVSMFMTGPEDDGPRGVTSGLRVGAWVTFGFVATFAAAGAVVTYVTRAIVNVIPWAALVVGIGLVALGIVVLLGRKVTLRSIDLRFTTSGSPTSMILFGVAYAIASISCTLPVFLAVSTQALAASNPLVGALVFSGYGFGMGAVMTALAVALAASREGVVRGLRGFMPYVERAGGWLLVGAGAYITYYWTANLAVTPGSGSVWLEPIRAVDRVSSWLTRSISDEPLLWLAVLAVMVTAVAGFERSRSRRDSLAHTDR